MLNGAAWDVLLHGWIPRVTSLKQRDPLILEIPRHRV